MFELKNIKDSSQIHSIARNAIARPIAAASVNCGASAVRISKIRNRKMGDRR